MAAAAAAGKRALEIWKDLKFPPFARDNPMSWIAAIERLHTRTGSAAAVSDEASTILLLSKIAEIDDDQERFVQQYLYDGQANLDWNSLKQLITAEYGGALHVRQRYTDFVYLRQRRAGNNLSVVAYCEYFKSYVRDLLKRSPADFCVVDPAAQPTPLDHHLEAHFMQLRAQFAMGLADKALRNKVALDESTDLLTIIIRTTTLHAVELGIDTSSGDSKYVPGAPKNDAPHGQPNGRGRPDDKHKPRMEPSASSASTSTDRDMNKVRCYNCNGHGHMSAHCPKPRRDRGKPSAVNSLGPPLTTFKLSLNGADLRVLVDSGARATALAPHAAAKAKLNPFSIDPVCFQSWTGENITATKAAEFMLKNHETSIPIHALIMPVPTGYDLVLGADTIVEHAMTIDLAADTVISYGREIFLPSDTVDTDADAANLNLLTESSDNLYEYRIGTTNADYTPTDILAEYEAVFRPSYGQHHAAAAPAKPKTKPTTRKSSRRSARPRK